MGFGNKNRKGMDGDDVVLDAYAGSDAAAYNNGFSSCSNGLNVQSHYGLEQGYVEKGTISFCPRQSQSNNLHPSIISQSAATNMISASGNYFIPFQQQQSIQSMNAVDVNSAEKKIKTTGPIHNSKYKLKLCDKFLADGKCPYNEKCQFAHGYEELNMWTERRKMSATFEQLQGKRISPSLSPSTLPTRSLQPANASYGSQFHQQYSYPVNENSAMNHFVQSDARNVKYVQNSSLDYINISSSSQPIPASRSMLDSKQEDDLVKSILNLLESGELGQSDDDILGNDCRDRLLSAELTDESFMSTPNSKSCNSEEFSISENPQGNRTPSPSKNTDGDYQYLTPFKSLKHSNMFVNAGARNLY